MTRNELPLKDILMRLVGPIEPIGSTDVDRGRQANLSTLADLVENLALEIREVAQLPNTHQASVEASARCARESLSRLADVCDLARPDKD